MSDFFNILPLRYLIYDMFSDLFYYKIEDEDYKRMLEKVRYVDENVTDLAKSYGNIDTREIREKLESVKKKDYLIEYTTLFLTGMGFKPLTPVESKRLFQVMGENVAMFRYKDLTRFYASRNLLLRLDNQFTPEPDHISSILAFMAYLINEQMELMKQGKDIQKNVYDQANFMTTHIIGWILDWAKDVINDNRSNIFKVICKNLIEWLNNDFKRLTKTYRIPAFSGEA